MVDVTTVYDKKRDCGWRGEGGMYLMSSGTTAVCGLMPLPLKTCPACGSGLEPSRSFRWIEPAKLFVDQPKGCAKSYCELCPLSEPRILTLGKALLDWVGKRYYKTPEDWLKEANEQGVSRRIHAIPKGFKVGHTWVFMAHENAIERESLFTPEGHEQAVTGAVYYVYKPDRIEYVTTGLETQEELEALVARGITPVRVVRVGEEQEAA